MEACSDYIDHRPGGSVRYLGERVGKVGTALRPLVDSVGFLDSEVTRLTAALRALEAQYVHDVQCAERRGAERALRRVAFYGLGGGNQLDIDQEQQERWLHSIMEGLFPSTTPSEDSQ